MQSLYTSFFVSVTRISPKFILSINVIFYSIIIVLYMNSVNSTVLCTLVAFWGTFTYFYYGAIFMLTPNNFPIKFLAYRVFRMRLINLSYVRTNYWPADPTTRVCTELLGILSVNVPLYFVTLFTIVSPAGTSYIEYTKMWVAASVVIAFSYIFWPVLEYDKSNPNRQYFTTVTLRMYLYFLSGYFILSSSIVIDYLDIDPNSTIQRLDLLEYSTLGYAVINSVFMVLHLATLQYIHSYVLMRITVLVYILEGSTAPYWVWHGKIVEYVTIYTEYNQSMVTTAIVAITVFNIILIVFTLLWAMYTKDNDNIKLVSWSRQMLDYLFSGLYIVRYTECELSTEVCSNVIRDLLAKHGLDSIPVLLREPTNDICVFIYFNLKNTLSIRYTSCKPGLLYPMTMQTFPQLTDRTFYSEYETTAMTKLRKDIYDTINVQ